MLEFKNIYFFIVLDKLSFFNNNCHSLIQYYCVQILFIPLKYESVVHDTPADS